MKYRSPRMAVSRSKYRWLDEVEKDLRKKTGKDLAIKFYRNPRFAPDSWAKEINKFLSILSLYEA